MHYLYSLLADYYGLLPGYWHLFFSCGENAEARENRKIGFFFLLIGFLIFVQIVVTPQAGGPHHYSMIFPLPLLAFVFLAQSMYSQIATRNLRRFAALLLVSAAICVFIVNLHNTVGYLSRFRTNSPYNPRLVTRNLFSFSLHQRAWL